MKKNISTIFLLTALTLSGLLNSCSKESDSSPNETEDETTKTEVTLFAPQGLTTTYLINIEGELIHSWESDYNPGLSVYLLDDETLLRTASIGNNTRFGGTGGAGGRVEQFDWNGNLLWEFEHSSDDYLLHHDIEYLPNGNILMIAWEYKSETEATDAGRDPSLLTDGELWTEKIIEVQPAGNSGGSIVWEWHAWDHLIQDYDASKDNYGVVADEPGKININMVLRQGTADWLHINAVDYNAELDQIMLTVHNFSEIWIIDHNTTTEEAAGTAGELLYRWGNPQAYDRGSSSDQKLFVPHNGHWIANDCEGAGDILIFNNGTRRPDGNYSTVDQITPPLADDGSYTLENEKAYEPTTTTWTYKASPSSDFYADRISGAQRLTNGNTLICEGTEGRFFEVTASGETVWEYTNPYSSTIATGNEVFRAVRYELDLTDNE